MPAINTRAVLAIWRLTGPRRTMPVAAAGDELFAAGIGSATADASAVVAARPRRAVRRHVARRPRGLPPS